MILLDTNYLIKSLVPGSPEAGQVMGWLKTKEDLCTSGICWYEVLCGPVDDEGIFVVSSCLDQRILPFTADQATEASRLFNKTGRKRHLRVDAMIAAAAIIPGAILATDNRSDFMEFVDLGLRLAERM
jgi:predicted nucleic acid-binding protein